MADNPNLEDEVFKKFLGESADILGNIGRIQDGISNINRSFGETRSRYLEFAEVVSDNVADFVRLGGEASDISVTIAGIAEGSRRNVVATGETVKEIFATATYLETTSAKLTENFAIIGVEMSDVAETTKESVDYIQSLGLNARTVMESVLTRMEDMNRFNFEGGVLGFTKMAAQASMLRFDMGQTVEFADKVMNPDGAIQMAAAFQRLGVATGDLVNPLVLMDKSINDPGGLQDSIIEMTKQFTYFDEATGNFKINPGSIRLLKEIASETGLSFENMTKTALAASDMDRRLSQISFGIQGSEEDKMLVANMAKMGENRKFYVEFEDETGKKQTQALENLSQAQFEQIKLQQANKPKTMEDLARAQLDTDKLIQRDIAALPMSLGYALAGQTGLVRGIETLRDGFKEFTKEAYGGENQIPTTKEFREAFQGVGDKLGDVANDFIMGKTSLEELKNELLNSVMNESIDLNLGTRLNNIIENFNKVTERGEKIQNVLGTTPDNRYSSWEEYQKQQNQRGQTTISGQVAVGGTINIKVDSPSNLTEQQVFNIFNNPEVQTQMFKIIKGMSEGLIKPLEKK
jgi:hypothetical protein